MPAAESTAMLAKFAAIAALGSALAAAMTDAVEAAHASNSMSAASLRETQLLLIVLVSAIGGALVCVFMFPERTLRLTSMKLTGSVISTIIIAPAVIEYLGQTDRIYRIMAISGTVAFFIWTALEIITPYVNSLIGWWGKKKVSEFADDENSDPPSNLNTPNRTQRRPR